MDYGKIFSRAWDIIWKYKFLILLGVLVALGGANSGGGNQAQYAFNAEEFQWGNLPSWENGYAFRDLGIPVAYLAGALAVAGIAMLVGLLFWITGTLARGGLIRAVDDIEAGQPAGFSEAFKAGWEKGWRLIGIGLIPAIPVLVLLIISLSVFLGYGGIEMLTRGTHPLIGLGTLLPVIVMACLLVPTAIVLGLLRNLANRACMLEDLGVISSYRRGIEVLGDNLGPALLLLLIQIALSLGIWMVMIIPGILIALCCLLWPLLILLSGAFAAYYSTLWTLAWREWTGRALAEPEQ